MVRRLTSDGLIGAPECFVGIDVELLVFVDHPVAWADWNQYVRLLGQRNQLLRCQLAGCHLQGPGSETVGHW